MKFRKKQFIDAECLCKMQKMHGEISHVITFNVHHNMYMS